MSVVAVSRSPTHNFSKPNLSSIELVAGYGVQDDCHYGTTVQHRSRLHIKPPPANLRQVHLIHKEIFDEIYEIDGRQHDKLNAGDLGENVMTSGIDLLSLGEGTRLHFVRDAELMSEEHAVIAVRGLRNPCPQIDKFRAGLKEHFIKRDKNGSIVERLAGVMCTVEEGGSVAPGMLIKVERLEIHKELQCV